MDSSIPEPKVEQFLEEATPVTDPFKREELARLAEERQLRKHYADRMLWILIVQLFVMNVVFALVGLGWLSFGEWSLRFYITGTLAEVFGVVLVIVNHLFPGQKK